MQVVVYPIFRFPFVPAGGFADSRRCRPRLLTDRSCRRGPNQRKEEIFFAGIDIEHPRPTVENYRLSATQLDKGYDALQASPGSGS